MVSAQARREQVDYAVSRGASVRRSCALIEVSRSALGYTSRMPGRDAELAEELQRIAAAHPRYGHRFAWAVLTQQRSPTDIEIISAQGVEAIMRSAEVGMRLLDRGAKLSEAFRGSPRDRGDFAVGHGDAEIGRPRDAFRAPLRARCRKI